MKKIITFTTLFATLLLAYCHKAPDPKPVDNAALLGIWTLTETLADPGDGSGKWMPVTKSDYYIRFKADDKIETNTYTGLGGLVRYRVVNDSSVTFFYASGQNVQMSYKISGALLTIQGGCIEACGSRFVK